MLDLGRVPAYPHSSEFALENQIPGVEILVNASGCSVSKGFDSPGNYPLNPSCVKESPTLQPSRPRNVDGTEPRTPSPTLDSNPLATLEVRPDQGWDPTQVSNDGLQGRQNLRSRAETQHPPHQQYHRQRQDEH